MKSVKYIDRVLQERGYKNDFALSKHLGWSSGAISMYRTGKRIMDDEACLALAMELNINPLEIIGAAGMDRAEKTGQKSLWEVFMSRTAATAASAVLFGAVNLFLTPNDANANPLSYDESSAPAGANLYYVKSQRAPQYPTSGNIGMV